MSSMALGPDDLAIMSSEIAALGHICQATEASPIAVPIGMSWAATRTSSVSSLGACATCCGGAGAGPLLKRT